MSISDDLRADVAAIAKMWKECPPEAFKAELDKMSYTEREEARIVLLKLYDIIKALVWKAERDLAALRAAAPKDAPESADLRDAAAALARIAARNAEDEAPEEDNEEDDPWEEIYGPPERFCLSLNGDATRPKHSGGSTTHLGDFYRTGGGGPESGYWVSKSLFKITHLIRRTWGEEWKIIESYPADRILTKDVDQGYGHTVTYVCLASKLGVK